MGYILIYSMCYEMNLLIYLILYKFKRKIKLKKHMIIYYTYLLDMHAYPLFYFIPSVEMRESQK